MPLCRKLEATGWQLETCCEVRQRLTEWCHTCVQEAGSYRPAVRPQRRREMVRELVAALPDVLNLLASLLQQPAGTPPAWTPLPHSHTLITRQCWK